ncbi:MAG: 6,7-dimethyl-8-ribityllumazine synthase [Bacteroidales bacterium]|nr:MAG: 6,7-dimethyl-8-ribityllumazine synthase [Bacteroidales bacterium]
MSTALSSGAPHGGLPVLDPKTKVAIVTAEWNSRVTEALTDGAVTLLKEHGVAYDCYHVPGAVELTYGAAALVKEYDAVIVFGCVIRGGTPHFDYVCDSVTQGVTRLNAKGKTPVIFGVLTVDTEQDAIDRAGGKYGNKGTEAAEAAIKMIDFACKVRKL